MKKIILLLIYLAINLSASKIDLPLEFLKETKGFFELFSQEKLKAYNCDIKLSGTIYKQLVHSSMKLGLTSPLFLEKYRDTKGFEYVIKNKDYSATSKTLLLGLFTPVKAFENIIKDFDDKKSNKWLLKLKSLSKSGQSDILFNNERMKKLIFLPKDRKKIDVKKVVLGTSTKSEWINTLELVIDPALDLIHKISITKTIIFKADTTEEINIINFDYKKINNRFFPIKMEILKDSLSRVVFSAEYKIVKDFVLFANKKFKYESDKDSTGKYLKIGTLNMEFEKYYFSDDSSANSNYFVNPQKEENAERIYVEAEELLLNGNAKKSKKLLKKIVKKYPETIAGKKSKILIEGL